MKNNKQSGFTLVELAIVLVIVGLIIGGVLVGQDMIKSAAIRSTATQLDRYNAAVNTFRDKYGYLPGDISSTAAARFGFVTRAGTTGQGDGNGLVQNSTQALTYLGHEMLLFWVDLNTANLVDGGFTTATDAPSPALTPDTIKAYLPEARIGRGNLFTVFAASGFNYYQLMNITATTTSAITSVNNLSPQEAFNIDQKTDDGYPATGITRNACATAACGTAAVATTLNITTGLTDDQCTDTSATPDVYNTVSEAAANNTTCQLRLRMQ